jgi:hypothetical protein
MKSIIVLSSFATALTNSEVKNLTKGQGVFITSKGTVLNGATDVIAADEYVQLAVGLGDGKVKRGVVLNPKNTISYGKIPYKAQAAKVITLSGLTVSANDAYTGEEVAVNITVTPERMYQGSEDRPFVASASVLHGGSSSTLATITTALTAELTKALNNMKTVFGETILTVGYASGTYTFTGVAGYNFQISFEANGVTGTVATSTVGVYNGIGSGLQVLEMEKYEDVAAIGYNPTFAKRYEDSYGDIFLADKSKNYNIYVISSKADQTDVLDTGTEGGVVKQIVAIDTTAVAAQVTKFETILSIIGQISNAITYPPPPDTGT